MIKYFEVNCKTAFIFCIDSIFFLQTINKVQINKIYHLLV